jgi:hypothetical protein
MRHQEHPKPDALLRFLHGEAPRTERRTIVRHHLAGCRQCAAVTRPIWLFADLPVQSVESLER